jgi:uncharacterized protein involved in exopolysaccharide biosynthesis
MNQLPVKTYNQLPPQGYYPILPEEEKEIHLLNLLRILQKRTWMIAAIFLIALTVAAIGVLTVRPVYRGTATIQIDKENPQIVDFREIFTVSSWDTDYYQTHYQVLASRK